jgi:hypothetical protein
MTFPHPADQNLAKTDTRLRAILSSWHRSPRYRSLGRALITPIGLGANFFDGGEFKRAKATETCVGSFRLFAAGSEGERLFFPNEEPMYAATI